MKNQIAIYPILGVARDWLDEPFDISVLPVQIMPDVTIEDAETLFPPDSFDLWKGHLAKRELEAMQRVRFAIVYRYDEFNPVSGSSTQTDMDAERLVRHLSVCLRLIRPMQQDASFIKGRILQNGIIEVQRFENPEEAEVLSVQKLFRLRNRDLERLKRVGPLFVSAAKTNSKFKMSAEFFNAGYFSTRYWQARFSLWCSALEALFTSRHYEHKGSLVAKERIKALLGSKTLIYEPGDIPSSEPQPTTTIEDVLDDLYELRNCVARGDQPPPPSFWEVVRTDYDHSVNRVEMLNEALSRIVRASLLHILETGLLQHFADGPTSEAYFRGQNLTRSALDPKRTRKT